MTELLFDTIRSVLFIGGFVLLLCIGEGIFNLLYQHSSSFRSRFDSYCESLLDYDEDNEVTK